MKRNGKNVTSIVLRNSNDDDVLFIGSEEIINDTKYSVHINFDEDSSNSGTMNFGALIAYQGVKEEIQTIAVELKRKGFDEPKGFSVLKAYIEDRVKELN